ncbi:HAUS augmin-like complex subunit 7 [Acanthaster planci]|uniref:HAUS augmin-like complex subunit 7 n=1 Tax=Acanthaster planci TaxID=133434 RepID=A0A8B7ZXD3_ACAPL|nr:HAUS augmin-like complex subunit 7 [Acanthaster planci]
MAGSSKDVLASSFKKRLQDLDCPYVDGVDESWISELLFHPGEARIRLLQWLFSRFDSKLAEMLDNQYVLSETQVDSRLQCLLQISTMMGLCKADEIDLMRGTSSSSKLIAFWDQLLDILCIVDTADNPQKRSLASPGIISESMTVEEQMDHDCQYISTLAAQRDLKDFFSTKLYLLPPDLLRMIENSLKEQGLEGHRPKPPDRSKLDEEISKLTKDVQASEAQLGAIKKQHDFPQSDQKAVTKVTQTLKLVLSELAQLVTSFSYCFESEMRQWCNKTPPRLTDLGPAVKRVYSLLQQFTTLLDSLRSIQTSYIGVCDTGQHSKGDTETKRIENLMSVSQAALDSFQECVGIMNESLQRCGEDWDASTTLGATFLR